MLLSASLSPRISTLGPLPPSIGGGEAERGRRSCVHAPCAPLPAPRKPRPPSGPPAAQVALGCTSPAKLYGLHPRKGELAVGADADVVLWDLAAAARPIRKADLHDSLDYTPCALSPPFQPRQTAISRLGTLLPGCPPTALCTCLALGARGPRRCALA